MVKAYAAESSVRADAYRLLEYAVRENWGVPCPEVKRSPRGKPFFPSRPDIFFSISHSGDRVMAAVGDVPLGCDVQLDRVPIKPAVVTRVCRESELSDFTFFELWTLKECWLKITDLPLDMRGVVFSKENGGIIPPSPAFRARLYHFPDYQYALVARSELPADLILVPLPNLR